MGGKGRRREEKGGNEKGRETRRIEDRRRNEGRVKS